MAICTILGVLLVSLFMPQAHSRRERSYAPITKEGLIRAIKLHGLKPAELVAKIKERGVAFQVTPDVETELRKAGASRDIIEACRDYYQWSQDSDKSAAVKTQPVDPVEKFLREQRL